MNSEQKSSTANQGVYNTNLTNSDIRAESRRNLNGKWGTFVGIVIVFIIMSYGINFIPALGPIISFLISPILILGFTICGLKVSRNEDVSIGDFFSGFDKFWKAFFTHYLSAIYIMLWYLLLIIPGIIASYRYRMIYFILEDDENVGVHEAISRSKELMKGNKFDLFMLDLSFIGWSLLSILTFGLGFLWLSPYANVSVANFYQKVKTQKSVI